MLRIKNLLKKNIPSVKGKISSGKWRHYTTKRIVLRLLYVFIFINIVLCAGVFAYFLFKMDDIRHEIQEYREALYGQGDTVTADPIQIFDRKNLLIGEYIFRRGSLMSMKRCGDSLWLRRAVVSSEDRNFYNHPGVSLRSIFRAFLNNLLAFSVKEGGGTITQQLARNLFTSRSAPALPRKIFETFAAFQIESLIKKDEILCLYMNKIYMGEGRIGAEEAARFYFSKTPEKLDVAEAAMIVGLFPSPVRYSPLNNPERSLLKQSMVIDSLIRDEWVKEEKRDILISNFQKKYKIGLINEKWESGKIGKYGARRDFRRNAAPAANEYVKYFLHDTLPEEIIQAGGLRVYTTVDYLRQRSAENAVHRGVENLRNSLLEEIENNQKKNGDSLDVSKDDAKRKEKLKAIAARYNGVFVVMDPENGELRAVVGGFHVAEGGVMFHRAWKMKRQTGSALKGFLYAAALDEGVVAFDRPLIDEPLEMDGYSPKNWYKGNLGRMSLRRAVALSVNTVAVKTLQKMGIPAFRKRLILASGVGEAEAKKRFPEYPSIALGTSEMTPVELTLLYASILNGGHSVRPKLILKIENSAGEILWQNEESGGGERVFSEKKAAEAIELLRGVFDEKYEGTMMYHGTIREEKFGFLPFPVAGKSGTVQTVEEVRRKFKGLSGVHDAWFVGLVPGEVSVVWFGHDEGAPFKGSGSGTAGSAWVHYAQSALPGEITGKFPSVDVPSPDFTEENELKE